MLSLASWWRIPVRSVLDVGAGKGYWRDWSAIPPERALPRTRRQRARLPALRPRACRHRQLATAAAVRPGDLSERAAVPRQREARCSDRLVGGGVPRVDGAARCRRSPIGTERSTRPAPTSTSTGEPVRGIASASPTASPRSVAVCGCRTPATPCSSSWNARPEAPPVWARNRTPNSKPRPSRGNGRESGSGGTGIAPRGGRCRTSGGDMPGLGRDHGHHNRRRAAGRRRPARSRSCRSPACPWWRC